MVYVNVKELQLMEHVISVNQVATVALIMLILVNWNVMQILVKIQVIEHIILFLNNVNAKQIIKNGIKLIAFLFQLILQIGKIVFVELLLKLLKVLN